MNPTISVPSPWQTFQDNIRPAKLLLQVYRLLDCGDVISSDGEMVASLRGVVGADADEDLMLIYNEIFLGLVREGAQLPRSQLRHGSLNNLLRQSVVASCTALETYLPALLRTHLPLMIKAQKRDFVPRNDADLALQFKQLTFNLDETLRIMDEPNPEEFISNKLLGALGFSYLSGSRGITVVGKLLGISDPWRAIAEHLAGDMDFMQKTVKDTVDRRNDIVHRADRRQSDPAGPQQPITFAWTKQATDTIDNACQALDELVTTRVAEVSAMLP